MIHHGDYVRDFAKRTRANLAIIEERAKQNRHHGDARVYEVTQLINSMLGLLVFPQQEYFNRIPRTPLKQLEVQGWPRLRLIDSSPPCDNLADLLRHMRNSISHFHVEFLPDPHTNHIAGLKLRDLHPQTKALTFAAEMTLNDLQAVTHGFVELLERRGIM